MDENNQNNREDSLKKLEQERDEYLAGWQRAKADLLNYKKDEARRFEGVVKFSNEAIVRDLINVLDSFDLAFAASEEDGAKGKAEKGVYLIRAQLEDAMRKYGLERLMVSVGERFDPALHESVAAVVSDKPEGMIVEEVERGYMLNGKLIRPARVKVAKK